MKCRKVYKLQVFIKYGLFRFLRWCKSILVSGMARFIVTTNKIIYNCRVLKQLRLIQPQMLKMSYHTKSDRFQALVKTNENRIGRKSNRLTKNHFFKHFEIGNIFSVRSIIYNLQYNYKTQ